MIRHLRQISGDKSKVRLVLGLMLFAGLLVVSCTDKSNVHPQSDMDPIPTVTNTPAIEVTAESTLQPFQTPLADPDLLAQAIQENAELQAIILDLIEEFNNSKPEEQSTIVDASKFLMLEADFNAMFGQESSGLSEIKDPYTEFLKNEITRLSTEFERIDNLGLRYDYSFPESGFPIEDSKEKVLALAEDLRSSIVVVQSGGGMGSGFVIGSDLIVTNEHVISGEGTGYRSGVVSGIIVKTFAGEEFNAVMIGYDKVWDVALLQTDSPLDVPALTWGDSKKLQNGDPLFAIGHPGQMGNWALTAGIFIQSETIIFSPSREQYETEVEFNEALASQQKLMEPNTSYKEGDIGTKTTLQTTVPGMIGSSGSPILNVNGEVIALLWGAVGIESHTDLEPTDIGAFKDPAPHIMHSVPVQVSREWTVGSPAWKVQELMQEWLK